MNQRTMVEKGARLKRETLHSITQRKSVEKIAVTTKFSLFKTRSKNLLKSTQKHKASKTCQEDTICSLTGHIRSDLAGSHKKRSWNAMDSGYKLTMPSSFYWVKKTSSFTTIMQHWYWSDHLGKLTKKRKSTRRICSVIFER